MIKVGILTISDKGSKGQRVDKSGQKLKAIAQQADWQVIEYQIVPDEKDIIVERLKTMVDNAGCDLVLTTGGTGLSLRDVTPEATKEVIEKEVTGLTEIIRIEGFKLTPTAILSRAVAGVRGQGLIVNLPGSLKGVEECMTLILPALIHGVGILKGELSECGNNPNRT